jgi:aryl-alcohol dehydrogenase-like predicted oxidoreductase
MSLGEDDKANARLLHEALDQGINFFDTADLYQHGQNEITVGKAFADRRAQVILATKVGNQWRPDGSGWDWNPTKAYILQAVESSLQRLRTDYLDLYQLHGGTLEDPIDETIEAFEILKQQGKIREYGISSIRPNVIREYVKRSNLASVMLQYSLLDRRAEESCLDLLKQHKIGVLVRGCLAQGLLAGKPAKPYLDYTSAEVATAAQAIKDIAGNNQPEAVVASQFALAHPAVSAVVLGIRTPNQLATGIASAQALPLPPTALEKLRQSIHPNQYQQHR